MSQSWKEFNSIQSYITLLGKTVHITHISVSDEVYYLRIEKAFRILLMTTRTALNLLAQEDDWTYVLFAKVCLDTVCLHRREL